MASEMGVKKLLWWCFGIVGAALEVVMTLACTAEEGAHGGERLRGDRQFQPRQESAISLLTAWKKVIW